MDPHTDDPASPMTLASRLAIACAVAAAVATGLVLGAVESRWMLTLLPAAIGLAALGALLRPHASELQALRESAADARRSREEAEAAGRVKAQFLANMSHEIRTPINGVLGMAELMLDTELSLEQREFVTTLQASGESLLRLVNDILDLSKVESGKLELDLVEFPLRDTLGDMAQPLAVRARVRGLELSYHVQPRVPDGLIGDPHRLKQVLINLLGNAIKFTECGEIVLRVSLASRDGEMATVKFSVSDTGVGIPADRMDAIFRPFEQADVSTTRMYGGTGLGLTIARQLVELMGGALEVSSQPGKGSEFSFTLSFKVGTGAAARSRRTQLGLIPDLPVLVVASSETSREHLEEMLVHWQLAPASVDSGAAALAALDRARSAGRAFGLVVIGDDLADQSRFELTRQIHRSGVHARTPVMTLIDANRPGDAALALDAGAASTLLKPVKPSKLARGVMSAVLGVDRNREAEFEEPQDEPRLPPLRILLAEDNEVNRKFAVRALERQGHSVMTASDGVEALDRWRACGIDLVLMDVQMPRLDGFEATRRIREEEAVSLTHIPIIAMTANALEGDREKCLAAGMDGYLSKPIRTRLLFAELQRVLAAAPVKENAALSGVRRDESDKAAPSGSLSVDAEPPFDSEQFTAHNDDDREFMGEAVQMFCEDSRRLAAEARNAAACGDTSRAAAAAHTLRGMIGNFFAAPAQLAAEQFEEWARIGDAGRLNAAADHLEAELERLRRALNQFVSQEASPS